MTDQESRRAGEALVQAARELARIWRSARDETRPGEFPGLADGIVASLIGAVGEGLVMGREPADAWARTEGVVRRVLDTQQTEDALHAEARLVAEVLASACDALQAGAHVTDFAARAADAARHGLLELANGGAAPRGVLVVTLLSGLRPRPRGPEPR